MRVKNLPRKFVVEELDNNVHKLNSKLPSTVTNANVSAPGVKKSGREIREEGEAVHHNEVTVEEHTETLKEKSLPKELSNSSASASKFLKEDISRQRGKFCRGSEDDAKLQKSVMNLLRAAKEDMKLESSSNRGSLKKYRSGKEKEMAVQKSVMSLLDKAKEDMLVQPPRRRGRPPKKRDLLKKTIVKCKNATVKAAVVVNQSGPKKRGRPRKHPVEAVAPTPSAATPAGTYRDSRTKESNDEVVASCQTRGRKKKNLVRTAKRTKRGQSRVSPTLKSSYDQTVSVSERMDQASVAIREERAMKMASGAVAGRKRGTHKLHPPSAFEATVTVRRDDFISNCTEKCPKPPCIQTSTTEDEIISSTVIPKIVKPSTVIKEEVNSEMNIELIHGAGASDKIAAREIVIDRETIIDPLSKTSAANTVVAKDFGRLVVTAPISKTSASQPNSESSPKEVIVKKEIDLGSSVEVKPIRKRGRPRKDASATGSSNAPTSAKIIKTLKTKLVEGMDKKAARKAKRRQMKLEEKLRKREARRIKKEMKEKLLREQRERRAAKRMKQAEEKLAWKAKKKGHANSFVTVEEAQKTYIEGSCDGILPVADMSFCWKLFVLGKVFMNRWLILREIPSNRYGVISYLVVENTEDQTEGMLYVQNANNSFATLPEEMCFLQEQAERGRSELFNTVVDTQFGIATEQSPNYFYYVVLLRESVSLKDLWTLCPSSVKESGKRKAWGIGTVGRLASDILSIIEVTYEAGYTFRNIDMSYFHLDLRTRRLYLDNASEVVVSTELKDLRTRTGEYVLHNYWRGCVEYAPLIWHRKGRKSIMRVADCAEVLFYMMTDMLGLLSWRGLNNHRIMVCKERFIEENHRNLPVPLIDYWRVVRHAQAIDASRFRLQDDYLLLDGIRGGATVSILDFRILIDKLLAMYKVFGGMNDEDIPFDFELADPDCPTKGIPEYEQLDKQIVNGYLLRYKLDILKADLEALEMRKEYAMRMAAQTNRERALALHFPGFRSGADNGLQKHGARGSSSDDSDNE